MGPTNVFDRVKKSPLLSWVFLKGFLSEFRIWKTWNWIFLVIWVTCFSGDMFKKKPIVNNDVCSYAVLAVCVWLYEGKRYSPLAIKKKTRQWLRRNMQFACLLQQKSGIHRSCVGKRNGLLVMILPGLKFICMLWKVKSAFTSVKEFQWWKRYSTHP